MADLLIHSMSEFADIISGTLDISGAKRIAEIGAEFGGMSTKLAEHAQNAGGHLYSIDPSPKSEFLDWVADCPQVTHIARPSLDSFGQIENIDAWVVDGDHNWFTVYHELMAIDAACRLDGKPMLVLLHDVAWPCGYRDFYYSPESIPERYRHDYCMESGLIAGSSDLHRGRGFRGMGQFGIARHEGGPRNGVKCAINDFIEAKSAEAGDEFTLGYAEVPAVFGLGVLFDMAAPWGEQLAELLLPYHDNAMIASLERNRLLNYLTVLDWQDGFVAHPGMIGNAA